MPLFGGKKTKKQPLSSQAPAEAGQLALPNPGEYQPGGEAAGAPRSTLGSIPARGYRAGGGTTLGPSERVALQRGLEFSAGGRSALVAGGPVGPAEPHLSARTGQVQISTTEDTSQEAGNVLHPDQPVQPPPVPTEAAVEHRTGAAGPEQRRDREGV